MRNFAYLCKIDILYLLGISRVNQNALSYSCQSILNLPLLSNRNIRETVLKSDATIENKPGQNKDEMINVLSLEIFEDADLYLHLYNQNTLEQKSLQLNDIR